MSPHDTPLIATIVAGLGLAFVFGTIAVRLRLPAIAGYLVAGIIIGPHTPGFVADHAIASELAEIGVIFLMFGVGLHFSPKELLAVRGIAIPGAIAQSTVATALGMGFAWSLGWPLGAQLVFGLSFAGTSTVVFMRMLQDHNLVDTDRGRIAVGWLVMEDMAMVVVLVLLPVLARVLGGGAAATSNPIVDPFGIGFWGELAFVFGKVIAFVAIMIVAGRRVIPWMMRLVDKLGSPELFRLGILATALVVGFGAAKLFGVSFALGAFFAGMILNESEFRTRAAEESLPLRDAFAVLFFVSVGMLFDPMSLLRHPWPIIATALIAVAGKSVVAFIVTKLFCQSNETALTIAVSLAQIGEFSFILADLGIALHLFTEQGRDLIIAGSIVSILLNPLGFALLDARKSLVAPWRLPKWSRRDS